MLSTVVVYAGGYVFLVFIAVCLATGLYYIAELVEEYTKLTKKVIQHVIQGIVALQVLLLLFDRLPLLCIAVGVSAHGAYYRLLRTFPYISLSSTDFLASVGLLVINNICWFRYFLYDPACRYLSLEYMLGFMLVNTWLVPFAFFISLAANESVLPGGPGAGSYGGYVRNEKDPMDMRGGSKQSRGVFLGLMNLLRKQRDSILPQVVSRIPQQYSNLHSSEKTL
eukprot:jgi/Mesvir1/9698/Mv12176-RA.1